MSCQRTGLLAKRLVVRHTVPDTLTQQRKRPATYSKTIDSITRRSFRPCTSAEVRRIIMTSVVKSCSLDPVTMFIVREFVDLLLPYLTSMVNASLTQGRSPLSQRHAVVTPLLKKTRLDLADTSNFHPVSNLSFMSKVIERAVVSRLTEYLSATTFYLASNQRTGGST